MTRQLTPTEPGRLAREHETFEIVCSHCHCTVEILASAIRNSVGHCPRCGTRINDLRWSEAITG